jgi:hypothetical protein
MWNSVITMTTVGYGEFFPNSYFGMLIAFIIVIGGLVFVGLFVVSLEALLTWRPGEEKAYELLKKLQIKEEITNQAGNIISMYMRISIMKKKNPINKKDIQNYQR